MSTPLAAKLEENGGCISKRPATSTAPAGPGQPAVDDFIFKRPAIPKSPTTPVGLVVGKPSEDNFIFKRPANPPVLKKLKTQYAERTPIELPKTFQNRPASLLTLPVDLTTASETDLETERDSLGVFDTALKKMEMKGLTHEPRYFRYLGTWAILNARHNGPRHPARDEIVNDIHNAEKLKSCFISQKMDAEPSDNSARRVPSFTPQQKRRFHAVVAAYKYLARNEPIPRKIKDAMRREPRVGPLTLTTNAGTGTGSCVYDFDTSHNIDDIIEVVDLDMIMSSSDSGSGHEVESE